MYHYFRLPAALLLSSILVLSLTAAPVFAADDGFSLLRYFTKAGSKVVVKSVEYDRDDREVEFEFKGSVKWKNPTVTIKRKRSGKNYAKIIKSKDSDELEVKVRKLTYGAIYSYTITGVKNRKSGSWQTVTGSFRAVDD